MSWIWASHIDRVTATIAPEEQTHLRKVLRRKPGSEVRVLDGAGQRADGTLNPDGTVAVTHLETLPPPQTTLVLALGARASNESALRRAAELGAAAVQPVYCARSRDAGAPKTIKTERWQTILRSGCTQSGNPWLPELKSAQEWSTFREHVPDQQIAVLDPLATTMWSLEIAPRYIAVGPEGGWTAQEIAGLRGYRLGRWVLRTPVAVATVFGMMALRAK